VRARRFGAALAAAAATLAAAADRGAPAGGGDAAPPAEVRRTLLGGAVAVSIPAGWVLQGEVAGCRGEGLALTIPCAALDAGPHSADVDLLAEPNAEREPLAEWSRRRRLAIAAPRRILEERAEPAWRTVISEGEDRGARYVLVERFGASPIARLHAVAAFPALPEAGAAWLARVGRDVDRFLGSIALAGAPPSAVRVVWDGRGARLASP
jgi:hypothetical protein